jgi:iron-sulfur cluster repair protein YtfE (RIC family)
MRDPIDQLLDEHRAIMAGVAPLRRAVADLNRHGEAALVEALPALEAVSRMMATDLLAHARREDEVLFPALEAALGTTATPTAVMREEHRVIHGEADLFHRTLRELNEVEHPALVAGGERLRTLTATGGTAEALRQTAETIIELLDQHFAKEEAILFPMARQVLSAEAMREVGQRMAALG